MWKMSKHTLYSFCLIYEKHLKYREATDDEDSDKEDTPVVESCILVETLMLKGERKRKKALRTKEAKKAKLALEANLEANSDEDSDLSSAFSYCSLDEDDDDTTAKTRQHSLQQWLNEEGVMVPKHTSVGASFMRNTSNDEDSDKEDTPVVESSEGELSCGDPDVESGNEGKSDFSEECEEEGERKRKKALGAKAHFSWCLIYEKHLKYRENDEDSDKEDTPVVESSEGELSCGDPDVESGNEGKSDFSEECEEEGERKRKKALGKKKAKKARLDLEGNSTSDEDSDLSSAFSDCSLDEDDEE
ncbi:hypothetical protein DAPPUDRAFT_258789 [Daphnia pulex]|uniref:Uncharacterized protein n=1 Tax=Daphnia pulex TaxID=6669 RepID=E9HG34_DAPPU|nr:hypothetical protein DAPPUDRAFT_258789 [Daphnia pulex]|eukprot:EFX69321.1 hypothetical protein DAPPUDRAFT_258789 [Daphnia pulex]